MLKTQEQDAAHSAENDKDNVDTASGPEIQRLLALLNGSQAKAGKAMSAALGQWQLKVWLFCVCTGISMSCNTVA